MKQIFRYLLVLVIASLVGLGMYYALAPAMQATTRPNFGPPGGLNPQEGRGNEPRGFDRGGFERDRGSSGIGGILFGLVAVGGRLIFFAVIIFIVDFVRRQFGDKRPRKV